MHNNLGNAPEDIGLVYMAARWYSPTLGRFISADTIIPNPANPQSYNRYSYVENRPLSFTDPTGHCKRPGDCVVDGDGGLIVSSSGFMLIQTALAMGMTWAGIQYAYQNPELMWELYDALIAGKGMANDLLHGVVYSDATAKPLTPDEEKHIERIGQMEGFLEQHPDLAEEAERIAQGEQLDKGKDHVTEAENRARMLEKAIRHLTGARPNRLPEAQELIDQALEQANNYLDKLSQLLNPGSSHE